jgi:intracellular multiplication protein IcmV
MKITRSVGRVIKPLVNFPKWMGLSQLRANAAAIMKMFQDLRVHRPPVREETFAQAVQRLNLTEDDIKTRMKHCLLMSLLYFSASLVFLAYTLYMIIHLHLGMVVGLLITALMMVFTYREHFWYFQMKTRTLGNTFQDWVSFVLRRGNK